MRFLTADWVLPIATKPIRHGIVVIEGEQIKALMTRDAFFATYPPHCQNDLEDFGRAIISPGLINLHTHLDYSNLYLLDSNAEFFPWIQKLTKEASTWSASQWQQSAFNGARQIALSGTTCIADSSYSGQAALALAAVGLRGVVGLELFGVDESKAASQFDAWLARYNRLINESAHEHGGRLASCLNSGQIQITVSPHAPYTVCPQLWSYAQDWACRHDLPLFTHLAESRQECSWIAHEEAEIETFLKAVIPGYQGVSWKGVGLTPTEHLHDHNLFKAKTIAAHTVHLSESDLEILARLQVKSVHCPRSNSRLRNGIAPYSKLLAHGIEVGFGTDSLASNDNLDVLSEACFAWNLQRAINPDFNLPAADAIYALTLGAAKILNLADKIGSLAPGKYADLAVFALADGLRSASDQPYEQLLYGKRQIKELLVSGKSINLDTCDMALAVLN